MAHLENCSLEDARRKLTSAPDKAALKSILSSITACEKAFTFISFYDRFGVTERNNMFACEDCFSSVVNFDDIPYVCKECGGQMVVARELIKEVR
ncbi:MAG: hypothetical protein AAB773_00875 [Patescibacteria group bacterium]